MEWLLPPECWCHKLSLDYSFGAYSQNNLGVHDDEIILLLRTEKKSEMKLTPRSKTCFFHVNG